MEISSRTSIITFAIALMVLSVASTSVHAALVTGVTATTSTEISVCCGDRDPVDMVNGSGLVAGLHDVNPSNMWLSIGTGFGGVDPDPFALFDLGSVHTINSFHVWNYNETGNFRTRGVNSVTVQYGTTMALGSTVAGISNFAIATGANGYAGQSFSGFSPLTARFIKFDINSNHGDTSSFFGLSEVQFNSIPEPTSASLALLGLGAMMLRRRRMA